MQPYYDHGGIVIYHGDCREALPEIQGDVVLTDPPYGVGFRYGESYWDGAVSDVLAIFPMLVRSAPLVALTPGLANVWRYPPATWMLAWAKPGSPRRSGLAGFNAWEPILVYGKPERRIFNDLIVLPAWNNTTPDAGGHPCPKPIRLMRWLVDELSSPDQMVIDPFMGSGTTLRAAKDLGRRAIGIEIEERYCEIAAKRLAQEVLFAA